jgi:hypothetical protein
MGFNGSSMTLAQSAAYLALNQEILNLLMGVNEMLPDLLEYHLFNVTKE